MIAVLWRIAVATVLVQTSIYIARPLLTYQALEFGADEAAVGALVVAFTLTPAVVALPVGRYCDRRSPTVMARTGATLLVVGAVASVLSPGLWWLFAATAVLGVGSLAVMLATQAHVARSFEGSRLDEGFGLLTTAVSIGQMLGPGVGGLLVGAGQGLSAATPGFMVAAALGVVATVVLWPTPSGERRAHPTTATRAPSWALLRRPTVVVGIAASTAILACADLLIAYLPLIGQRNGLSPEVVGLLLSVRAAASVAVRLSIPRLLRRFAAARLLVWSLAVPGVLVACLVVPMPVWAMFVTLTLVGGFLGLGQPLTMAMLVRATPASDHGAALSLRLSGTKVGQVAAAAAIAGLTGVAGVSAAFLVLGAGLLVGAAAVRVGSGT